MENQERKYNPYLPLYFALVLVAGVLIGKQMNSSSLKNSIFPSSKNSAVGKINQTFRILEEDYVDTINEKALSDEAISAMLQKLDPHSFYIPADELQSVNESLEGNFDGIGVEFNIHEDTILVVTPISGGPSEELGIRSGDRIIKIEDTLVAGVGISNKQVIKKLRGPSGTKVKVEMMRRGSANPLKFTITRGKIPILSIDATYMVNDSVGYIKINRFAENTYEEYKKAYSDLKKQGLKRLILDLRNNPGGYLKAATMLADEFLDDNKLIVYTQGRSRPKTVYKASSDGEFEKGKLVILIDEGSASASEIVSGAVQDWDRGVIVGRRSFGKGLVQDQTNLEDGSALRLTIARYYTPSGRCIQKPYHEGKENYNQELERRVTKGELENADSISFPDSLKFKTKIKGRTVYGGGGIMPDVFVPLDTTVNSIFLGETLSGGFANQFVFDFMDRNPGLAKKYKNLNDFRKNFTVSEEVYQAYVSYVKKSIKEIDLQGVQTSSAFIKNQLKALIGRSCFKNEGYYSVINDGDKTFMKAVELMNSPR